MGKANHDRGEYKVKGELRETSLRSKKEELLALKQNSYRPGHLVGGGKVRKNTEGY